MSKISENLIKINHRITEAACKVNRDPRDIQLITVTKTRNVAAIEEAIDAGATDIGENRVQEIREKFPEIGRRVRWHLIGHLQTNKVKYIVDSVDLIHSLDRYSLAEELNKKALKPVPVLVQVNVAQEESKFGLCVSETIDFVQQVAADCENIAIQGLMTIAPHVENVEETRIVFRQLRQLFEQIKSQDIAHVTMNYLSMGMSNDFEIAIEEGANMIRLGTAIFGPRN